MPEFEDVELADILTRAPGADGPRRDVSVIENGPLSGSGKQLLITDKAATHQYVMTANGVFPMTSEQKSFYDWCVLTRDPERAAAYVQVPWDTASKWLADKRAVQYMFSQVKDKADAASLTADHLDALVARGLSGELQMNKNQVKLLELAQKRLGLLIERRVHEAGQGTELVFAVRRSEPAPAAEGGKA